MTVKVIAECGVNYSNFEEAKLMIAEAKKSGSDYVKFQLFNEETIADSPFKERLEPLILDEDKVKTLKDEADKCKIGFVLTPMYPEAVDIVAKYADAIKIRFKDHENEALIDKAVETGKTVLMSVPAPLLGHGDRTWPFISRVYQLYCIPRYPPEPEDFNLDQACACKGFSSHFPHTLFDLAFAINRIYNDVFIEKHVMLGIGYRAFFTKESLENPSSTAEIYFKPEPIDAAVSIGFPELKNFISQLQLIERIQRTRI